MDLPTSRAGSQEASTSIAHQAPTQQASDKLSKQVERDENEASSSKSTASVSPSLLLPIELLVEIFRYLSTNDVARAARVCSVWHAASNDSRIWRHLSFTRFTISDLAKKEGLAQLDELIKSFSARCGNTVESVDFSNLPLAACYLLAEEMVASAQTLKSIRGASAVAFYRCNAVCSVLTLAKQCASLETLELYGLRNGFESEQINYSYDYDEDYNEEESDEPCSCSPQNVKLSFYKCVNRLPATGFFSRVTTLEIKYASGMHKTLQKSISVLALHQLFTMNSAIERLTVHGLYGDFFAPPSALSAPSLIFLDLSSSVGLRRSPQIAAPKLRELVIDDRLLPGVSCESLATLSALTLRIADPPDGSRLDRMDRIKSHRGSLKLVVDKTCTEGVLTLLSDHFIWPGLEEVDIKIERSSVSRLVSVMATRQAGSLGASGEQYAKTASKAHDQLQNALGVSESAFVAQAEQVLVTNRALQGDSNTPPLCSPVTWRLSQESYNIVAPTILDWLEQQPGVMVARA